MRVRVKASRSALWSSTQPELGSLPLPARLPREWGRGQDEAVRLCEGVRGGVYRFPQMESVVFGKPFPETLGQEVGRLDPRAVFVLASGTLSRETDLVERLRQVLGNRFGG